MGEDLFGQQRKHTEALRCSHAVVLLSRVIPDAAVLSRVGVGSLMSTSFPNTSHSGCWESGTEALEWACHGWLGFGGMLGKPVPLAPSGVCAWLHSPVLLLALPEDVVFPLPWAMNIRLDIYLLSSEERQRRECNGLSKHTLQPRVPIPYKTTLMASFYRFQYFSGDLSSVMVLARSMNCGVAAFGGCPACARLTDSLKGSWSGGQDCLALQKTVCLGRVSFPWRRCFQPATAT